MSNTFIPVNTPLLGGNELEYVTECIKTAWISSEGSFVKEFEEKFAGYVNRNYAIAVSNGSMALEAAIRALDIGEGDEVIVPAFTIISCVAAIVKSGATPVLVDADPETWNMDVTLIEEKISSRTKAIMPVHIYGLPVEMDRILELANRYELHIIEDAAEVIGQTYNGRKCGSFGDISTFSFYANKHITTGEGGMIVCDDAVVADRLRSLRNLCFQKEKRFVHNELGWNLRITNLQAAVGLAQLERIDQIIDQKRTIGNRYNNFFKGTINKSYQLPVEKKAYAKNIYWVFGLVSKDGNRTAEEIMQRLDQVGIGTRPFFYPMHKQPVFNKMGLFQEDTHPVSEWLSKYGFYIPSGLALSTDDINKVIDRMREVL
ncbi:MAG: DegT/DnrJ/EryC1/StrS family aminotransferase [Bacteroidota bacterium]